jgi:hypothetical protein
MKYVISIYMMKIVLIIVFLAIIFYCVYAFFVQPVTIEKFYGGMGISDGVDNSLQTIKPWTNTTNDPLFGLSDPSGNIVSANTNFSFVPVTPPPSTNSLAFGQVPIPETGIPPNYYQTGEHYMSQVPLGYIASPDRQNIIPQIQSTLIDLSSNDPYSVVTTNASNRFYGEEDSSNNITHYDPDNYNLTYHADENTTNDFYDISVNIPNATYYQPGSFPYGPSSWVPNYEDSIYLSKLTGYSSNSLLYNTASQKSGICVQYQNDPQGLEEKCNKLDQNVCASTSCCVLLGGSKCVSGNVNGPALKSNYSDFFIKNREYYYYNGRCYGNCEGQK